MKEGRQSLFVELVFPRRASLYCATMGFPRIGGGDWEPLLLGIEPRKCTVCTQGLYRDQTLFRGGWSRCTKCNEFVHYSCLASGRVSFLKRRPRVCKSCATPSPTSSNNPGHQAA